MIPRVFSALLFRGSLYDRAQWGHGGDRVGSWPLGHMELMDHTGQHARAGEGWGCTERRGGVEYDG